MYPSASDGPSDPWCAWWQFPKARPVVKTGPIPYVVDQDVPADMLKAYSLVMGRDAIACMNCRKPTRSQIWLWWVKNPNHQKRYFVCYGCTSLAEAMVREDGWVLVQMAKWRAAPKKAG